MDKLVIDHSYALGIAWDRTIHRNHGVAYQAPPGGGFFAGCLSFAPGRTAPGSAVAVPPSPSLRELGAIRVRARICVTGAQRRFNVAEGHLSFALFVTPDRRLMGTFLDPSSAWVGIQSAPNTIVQNRFHDVEYWYDGISAAELLVDGTVVASTWASGAVMAGPVRGVGPHGVFIGHWPERDDRYTFQGYIRSFQLYKRDDLEDLLKLLDPCCLRDLRALYELGNKLRRRYDQAYLDKLRAELLALGTELTGRLRGNREADTKELNRLLQAFLYAIAHRELPIGPPLRNLVGWLTGRMSRSEMDDVVARAQSLLGDLPLGQDELLELGNALCFGKLRAGIEEEVRRMADDPSWRPKRRPD